MRVIVVTPAECRPLIKVATVVRTRLAQTYILGVSAALLAAAIVSEVNAATETVCVGYARHAVKEATEAKNLGCGFTGPRWSTDHDTHFNWCKGAEGQTVSREAVSRGGPLMNCSSCRSYADAAANAARTNIDRRCGFSGPRWTTDTAAHFGWCMKVGSGAAAKEASARQAELSSCKREFPNATIPPPKASSCPSNMFLGQDGTCYPILR